MRSSQSQTARKAYTPHKIKRALTITIGGVIVALCLSSLPAYGQGTVSAVTSLLTGLRSKTSAISPSQAWRRERSNEAPSVTQALSQCGFVQTKPLGPLNLRQRYTVVSDELIGFGITGLFFVGSPPTITWLIVARAVAPIQGMAKTRLRSHVIKERDERGPSSADGYPDSAITIEVPSRLVQAAASHRYPSLVFGSASKSMSLHSLNLNRGFAHA